MIFVVDSSDRARMAECRDVMNALMTSKSMADLPYVVVANKQVCGGNVSKETVFIMLGVKRG